jgi:hypothetical protein
MVVREKFLHLERMGLVTYQLRRLNSKHNFNQFKLLQPLNLDLPYIKHTYLTKPNLHRPLSLKGFLTLT